MNAPSIFRRSLPVTVTSFINRTGSIGLSIIPVILVERQFSSHDSAWIMGFVKAGGLLGIWLGGWCCDRLGLRRTLLLSFALSAVGLAPIPFAVSAGALAGFAFIAQLGNAFYPTSARLLITQLVEPGERREAIGWQRTANNSAQIVAYSLGAFLGKFGSAVLIWFDALTALAASIVGTKLLPQVSTAQRPTTEGGRPGTYGRFLVCTAITAVFIFLYELYMTAAAAQCRILFGAEGLSVFSQMMVINTIFCASLSLFAARHLTNPARALPVGMLLTGLGLIATFGVSEPSRFTFYLGNFLLTIGEIVFNALAGLVLIQLTPPGKKQGQNYGFAMLINYIARVAGAAAAFPWVVNASHPLITVTIGTALGVALCLLARRILAETQDLKTAPASP
ncbi:MAG: MFS transporter [Bacteriovoracia bacterium]